VYSDACASFVQPPGYSCADIAACAGNKGNFARQIQQLVNANSVHCAYRTGVSDTPAAVAAAVTAARILDLINFYDLAPLPVEGTLYASTFVSASVDGDGTPIATAIVGLYARRPVSRSFFHRLTSDEIWHFYEGDPLRLILLDPDGSSRDVVLGPDYRAGQRVQFVVPAGVWQAGELATDDGKYALFGCTMSPGFTGSAFEGGQVDRLLASHPQRSADIHRLGLPDQDDVELPLGFTQ
jgi:predicted cupin superfamily sugar epimerase